jgi:uncharacterized membrane protein
MAVQTRNGMNGKNGSDPVRQPAQGQSDRLTRANVRKIAELEEAALQRRGTMDRVVDAISSFCGSTAFVWVHTVWFGVWIVFNALPGMHHVDPFPFQFLTFVVSLEAILLSTFILISQNRQNRLQERRNHLDLQVNLLSEQESTKSLRLLTLIAKKLDIAAADDPDLRLLTKDAAPEVLIEEIERAMEGPPKEEDNREPAS